MSIIIKGDNKGLILDGSVDIDHIEFEPGVGIKNVSGVRRHGFTDFVDAEEIQEAEYTEVEETSVAEEQTIGYHEITDENRRFFKSRIWVEMDGKPRKAVVFPVENLLHSIHDLTLDWNPEERTSVHKWKILYETLSRMGYLYLEQRPRYTSFVKAVVMYCFPDTEDKYGGNIKKTALDSEYNNWSYEDKALFQELNKALDIQTLTSPK